MVTFCFEFEKNKEIKLFFDNFKLNSEANLFMKTLLFTKGNIAFIHIKPLIFPIYYLGLMLWAFGYVLSNFTFNLIWFVPGLIMCLSYVFYTKTWYTAMFRIGLKKYNYKGKIKIL